MRIRWSAIIFLFVFAIVAVVVAYCTVIPGLEAAKHASDDDKRKLVAWFRLLLAVLLFILFAGLVLTVRFGRFFFPRASGKRTRTQYVDAWGEAGRRMETPPGDEE